MFGEILGQYIQGDFEAEIVKFNSKIKNAFTKNGKPRIYTPKY